MSMKMQSTIKIAALAALAVSPLAFAEDVAEPTTPEVAICDTPADDIFMFADPVVAEGTADTVIEEPSDTAGKVVIKEPTDTGAVDTSTDEEVSDPEDGGVPIEWVIRGGELENPDVIFYNMAGGPGSVADNGSSNAALARDLGKDEKAAAIENNASSGASVGKTPEKSTVAVVKQGRVFLR